MVKITELPINAAPDGSETIPHVKDGVSMRSALAPLIAPVAQPYVDEAQAAAASISGLFDVTGSRYLRGALIAGGVMDSAGRMALAWGPDGTLFGKFAIALGAASNGLSFVQDAGGIYRLQLGTVAGQLPIGSGGDVIDTTTPRYWFGQAVLWAVAGSANGGGAVITADGTLHAKLAIDLAVGNGLSFVRSATTGRYALKFGTVEGQLPIGSGGDVIDTTATRYYGGEQVLSAILDINGRAAQIVTKSGKVYIPGLQSSSALSTTLLYMGGDSLIDGSGSSNSNTKSLTPRIAYYLGCGASWLGVPGSYSHAIADRETSIQLTLSGNVLPANGTATVTGFRGQSALYATSDNTGDGTNAYWTYQPLSSPATNRTIARQIAILGVKGTLTRTASGGPASTSEAYTFTYPAMPASLPLPGPVVAAAIPPAGSNLLYGIWLGTNDRNNYNQWTAAATRWMNAHVGRRRFVIGPLNSTSESNASGNWGNVRAGMAILTAAFEHVIDAQSELVRWGLLAAGLTPTSQDLTDMAAGKISAQLSADGLHLNDAGYDALAQIVACHFLRWGWVTTAQLAVIPTLWASWSA
ncbi:hypothetical protein [Novosphingobium humi]|uniref:hypothetical protein n=1 Tax=Novosphingobium humi TaxID=2282397 RepID=UPI0025AFB163|nr:hypothetical protein [Novosphingobium humi]WJS97245.1 hypothetical protein NYQ05_08675 [Novosphingobium humi]